MPPSHDAAREDSELLSFADDIRKRGNVKLIRFVLFQNAISLFSMQPAWGVVSDMMTRPAICGYDGLLVLVVADDRVVNRCRGTAY